MDRSVAEHWAAQAASKQSSSRDQGDARSQQQSKAPTEVELVLSEVRSVGLAEHFGSAMCDYDCIDADWCMDGGLYYLEFSRHDNHYRFLKYISMKMQKAFIIDLGTHGGGSSFALSSNPSNTIISFDLTHYYIDNHAAQCNISSEDFKNDFAPNVQYRVGDALATFPHMLLDADLIVLDTAHEGEWEEQLYNFLSDRGYQGLMVLDDIHANPDMVVFWASIRHTKYDITYVGHAISGTGLVDFGGALKLKP